MKKIFIAIYSLILLNVIGFLARFNILSIQKSRNILKNNLFKLLNISINIDEESIENLNKAKNKQIILISNHRTILDPLIIQDVLEISNFIDKKIGYWLAKEDLYKSPFFGLFTRNTGTILVPKSGNTKEMISFMKNIDKTVKNGNNIFVFPEGTRNKTDKKILPFEKGTILISLKNKLDVLPIYIEGKPENILKGKIKNNNIINIKVGNLISFKNAKKIEEIYLNEFKIGD